MTNEVFSRVKIDVRRKDWERGVGGGNSVWFEYVLQDATRADYVLCDRHGRVSGMQHSKELSY